MHMSRLYEQISLTEMIYAYPVLHCQIVIPLKVLIILSANHCSSKHL